MYERYKIQICWIRLLRFTAEWKFRWLFAGGFHVALLNKYDRFVCLIRTCSSATDNNPIEAISMESSDSLVVGVFSMRITQFGGNSLFNKDKARNLWGRSGETIVTRPGVVYNWLFLAKMDFIRRWLIVYRAGEANRMPERLISIATAAIRSCWRTREGCFVDKP